MSRHRKTPENEEGVCARCNALLICRKRVTVGIHVLCETPDKFDRRRERYMDHELLDKLGVLEETKTTPASWRKFVKISEEPG